MTELKGAGFKPGQPRQTEDRPGAAIEAVEVAKEYNGPSMSDMVERLQSVLSRPSTAHEVMDQWKAWSDGKPGELGDDFRGEHYPDWDSIAFDVARRAAEAIISGDDTLSEGLVEAALIEAMKKELAGALIMKERMGAFVGGEHAKKSNLDNTDGVKLKERFRRSSGVAAVFTDEDWQRTLQLALDNRSANLKNW